MSKFFIGQRVRILWSMGWPELLGQQGRIVGIHPTPGRHGLSEWQVAPDCWGSQEAPRIGDGGGTIFAPNSSQLEPILPDGAQPLGYSFEQMMSEFGVTEAVK